MYILISYKATSLGLIKHFYANDGHWYVATNNVKNFQSKELAKSFYSKNNINMIATQVLIQGPKKGIYRMSEV